MKTADRDDGREPIPRRSRGRGRVLRTFREVISPKIGQTVTPGCSRPPRRRPFAFPIRGCWGERHVAFVVQSRGWVGSVYRE